MRLDCLGSGFAFSHGRYWSGFLLDGRILLDCPPQTLAHLFRLGVRSEDLDLVLLSHEHSDHIGGVDLLLLEAIEGGGRDRDRPLAIAGPPRMYERLREIIGDSKRLPPQDDPRIAWYEVRDGDSFEWAGAAVGCREMRHAPELVSLGFRVDLEGRALAYSGDTAYCGALLELAHGADLAIVECGGSPEHGHMAWADIERLRGELPGDTRLLVTHYDPDAVPLHVRDLEGIELAEDFAVYDV